MIKLQDAELITVLPPYVKKDPDVQAISYAFKMGMEKFLKYSKAASLYGAIDQLPGHILDLLALELQSHYYEETLELGVKRGLVKNALAWHLKGGTVSAVEEMIQVVFGDGKSGKGKLEEWYEYGGKPGTFRIKLNTEEHDVELDMADVIQKINLYKKLSAHIEAIGIGYSFYVPVCYENRIRMRSAFYPRLNIPKLSLNGMWKLDKSQRLSGYDGYGRLDFYPVAVKFQANIRGMPQEKLLYRVVAGAGEKLQTAEAVSVKVQAECKAADKVRMRIQVPVEAKAETGDIRMYNRNRLDGVWKLDGRRKLNGGVSVL